MPRVRRNVHQEVSFNPKLANERGLGAENQKGNLCGAEDESIATTPGTRTACRSIGSLGLWGAAGRTVVVALRAWRRARGAGRTLRANRECEHCSEACFGPGRADIVEPSRAKLCRGSVLARKNLVKARGHLTVDNRKSSRRQAGGVRGSEFPNGAILFAGNHEGIDPGPSEGPTQGRPMDEEARRVSRQVDADVLPAAAPQRAHAEQARRQRPSGPSTGSANGIVNARDQSGLMSFAPEHEGP